MAKNDLNTVPLSKSQRNKGKNDAKRQRKSPIEYGGVCSSCGQKSSSCTTNTTHLGCKGLFEGEFDLYSLKVAHEKRKMLFTGEIVRQPVTGTWRNGLVLILLREKSARQMSDFLENQVLMTSVFREDGSFLGLDVANGFGDPLVFQDGKWSQAIDEDDDDPSFEEMCKMYPIPEPEEVADNANDSWEKLLPNADTVELTTVYPNEVEVALNTYNPAQFSLRAALLGVDATS